MRLDSLELFHVPRWISAQWIVNIELLQIGCRKMKNDIPRAIA